MRTSVFKRRLELRSDEGRILNHNVTLGGDLDIKLID